MHGCSGELSQMCQSSLSDVCLEGAEIDETREKRGINIRIGKMYSEEGKYRFWCATNVHLENVTCWFINKRRKE